MAFQTAQAPRPILQRGPVPMPVVNRDLVRKAVPVGRPRNSKEKTSPEVIAEIIARRQRGESYGNIKAALNVGHGTISRYTKHVEPPPSGWPNCWQTGLRKPRVYNYEFAARLRRSGFSYDEIGRELGCTNWTVIKLLDPKRKRLRGKSPTSDKLRQVAAVTGFSRCDLRKVDGYSTREAELTKARHIAFWVLRVYRDLSYPVIGKSLGGYDHSTIIHGVRRADAVAVRLAVTSQMRPRKAIRALWNADWREGQP